MIHIYKPNAKNAGCAASFSCGYVKHKKDREELVAFIEVIQQYSWDSKAKTGSFSENKDNPEKKANIKLNDFEVGEIIHSLFRYKEFSAYHTFGEDSSQIKLTPWIDKNSGEKRGWGLSITKNGIKFSLPITFGEAEVIRIFFEGILLTKFRSSYAKKA